MFNKVFTNCFLVKTNSNKIPTKVLLAMKKRGFGKGMWNGSGGKPNSNESIKKAAIREVQEEFGVYVDNLEKRGEIHFILKKEKLTVRMHVFLVTNWKNNPVETEEMKPKWFSVNNIPYDKMWEADKEWLPVILSGKIIKARYTYAKEGGSVLSKTLKEVSAVN